MYIGIVLWLSKDVKVATSIARFYIVDYNRQCKYVLIFYNRHKKKEQGRMNRNLLKTVIYDQHTAIKNFQIVDREYAFNMNVNYVLVGLRRAEKINIAV